MKKALFLMIALAMGLSACVQNTPVAVVEVQEDRTAKRMELPAGQTPPNATAFCRDGAFSFASDDSTCIGNGGVQTFISRYYSE